MKLNPKRKFEEPDTEIAKLQAMVEKLKSQNEQIVKRIIEFSNYVEKQSEEMDKMYQIINRFDGYMKDTGRQFEKMVDLINQKEDVAEKTESNNFDIEEIAILVTQYISYNESNNEATKNGFLKKFLS